MEKKIKELQLYSTLLLKKTNELEVSHIQTINDINIIQKQIDYLKEPSENIKKNMQIIENNNILLQNLK